MAYYHTGSKAVEVLGRAVSEYCESPIWEAEIASGPCSLSGSDHFLERLVHQSVVYLSVHVMIFL